MFEMISEEKSSESESLQQRVQILYHVDHGNAVILDVNWNTQENKAVFRNEFNQDSFINAPREARVTIRQVLNMHLVDMHQIAVNDIMIPRSWEWNAILDSPVEEVEVCQIEIWSYMGQVATLEHAG
jgi:Mg2+/Co2+ transporter CorB